MQRNYKSIGKKGGVPPDQFGSIYLHAPISPPGAIKFIPQPFPAKAYAIENK